MPCETAAIRAGWKARFLFTIVLFTLFSDRGWCQSQSNGAARRAEVAGFPYYMHVRPYLDERPKRLIKHIPELAAIRPVRSHDQQDWLPTILMHAGLRVDELFHNLVDLTAREDVWQEILAYPDAAMASQHVRYNYLILLNQSANPLRYEEYRSGTDGNRAEQQGLEQGFSITSGFALKCIYFSSGLRSDSVFRYLGDEMIGTRDTYVVAFAQRPETATFSGTVMGVWGSVRILDQGIAWIDKNTFQILRIRTDLLAAHSDIGLRRQTTTVNFAAVQIPDVPAPLWLPSDARVDADFQGSLFRNEHRYSEYQRFRVSVKMATTQLSFRPDPPDPATH